jgi:hypothetical protein
VWARRVGKGYCGIVPYFPLLEKQQLTVKNAISSAILVCLYVGLTIINGYKNGQPFFFLLMQFLIVSYLLN